MKVELTSYTPNPEKAIIEAAAVSYRSKPREEILDHIIQAGHWTPLEFAVFNFRIEGISRACSHQLVRKRVGVAFVQESQRYIDCKDGYNYVMPPSIENSSNDFLYCGRTARQIYNNIIHRVEAAYEQLRILGIPPEDARFVLPNACTTTIAMSINYHALLDLAKERLCSKSQWEIRELVEKLRDCVSEVSPKLAGYLQPKCYWLKHCPEKKGCGKHERIQGDS